VDIAIEDISEDPFLFESNLELETNSLLKEKQNHFFPS